MFKSISQTDPAGPDDRGSSLIEIGLAILLAAAWIAFVAMLLQNSGTSNAREPGLPRSTQSTLGDSASGATSGDSSSLRAAPAGADPYRGADVDDLPAEVPVSGWMG